MTVGPDALARVTARGRLGIRLGLGRTRAILAALGDPQLALRGTLVGGTNGKGSTQAVVASALRAAGLRVGQTPKPHLSSYRERMVVDGRAIAEEDMQAVLGAALTAADRVERRHGPATEFELLTVAAFLWLAHQAVDVAVVEVGLGGRLDATNAWDGGVAAITNVGLDHQELLGPDIVSIAREKAAIIKRGDRAVTGAEGAALAVIRRRAARMAAPLHVAGPLHVEGCDLAGTRLVHPRLGQLDVGLIGRHQAANVAVALAVLEALAEAGIASVGEAALRRGLRDVRWPGRLEVLRSEGVTVLLDGAHNPDGAAALSEAVEDLHASLPGGRATLLLGLLADKDVTGMLAALSGSRRLRGAHVVATQVPGTPRAMASDDLAAAWGAGPAEAVDDVGSALRASLRLAAREGGPLVVAGSLYLVGHVRDLLTAGSPDLRS